MKRRHLLTAPSLLVLPAWAQSNTLLLVPDAEQREVLRALAVALRQRFVFPEEAERYARHLMQRADALAVAEPVDAERFAADLTAQLQGIHPDRHLRVRLSGSGQAMLQRRPLPTAHGQPNPALAAAEMRGEVAYLKFLAFPMDPGMARAVRGFLIGPAAQAKAVVIDAREHRGGTLLVMDALLPLLYGSARTLLRMDTRSDAYDPAMTPAGPTLVRQVSEPSLVRHDHRVLPDPEHRSLNEVPLLMLISGRTASAAEHLALALQRSGRGLLVGETTAGAGHFGGPVAVGRFEAFIPIGRTYDPTSGQDWEGRGIEPDIRVPQDRALEHARQYLATRGIALS